MDEGAPGIVGREREFALVQELFEAEPPSRSLVLAGGAGIGKTTLWEAGIAAARERGLRVLASRPSGAEARLSFATLTDLWDGIELEGLADVPAPQRAALEVALLRAEPTGVPPGAHAVALGTLNTLRALAAAQPVVVAVDDLQWLDDSSADVLAFVARRLEGEPVAFLLARRPGRPSALEQALARRGLSQLDVGPLSVGAARRLLSERLGLSLSRQLLHRVVDVTLGNPLFTLELGRMLGERGLPRIGEDIPVPDTIEDLLGTRVSELPGAVRRLLLAVALSAELSVDEGDAITSHATVERALDAGLLALDGESLRGSHPLLAAAAKERSRPRERRELHLALAGVVVDAELRARHLALASEYPDAALAAAVAAAADGAFLRGARGEAVELAEHALRLTPAGSADRAERVLTLADYLDRAGEPRRATELLTPEVASMPAGSMRARAWLLLAGNAVESSAGLQHHLELALAECHDDPGLRASVLANKAANIAAGAVARLGEAEAWALEALQAAPDGGPEVEREALYALAWPRALTGRPIDDLCERSRTASDISSYIAFAPERVAGQRLVWRGEMHQAREILTRYLLLADQRGEPSSYALQRLHMCELELRAGAWDAAARLLDEWAQSTDRDLLFWPMYERCRALLAAGRGLADEAERWATEAIARAEATGCEWDKLEALRALGMAALLAHDPKRAAQSLREVWEHTMREGVDEPGVFPVAPELVEALVELGELDRAGAVTVRLRELAVGQQHPWGMVTASRCCAVVRLASGHDRAAAAAAMVQAAADYERLGLPFDRARTLLSVGRAQRRVKQWGAARSSLEMATTAFAELGSNGWAEQARLELDRVGARRPSPTGELTATERRVVDLAATGSSNKEIARALYVTVHTVEAHLSHAYAKLGVRSRGQLAGRLSTSR